MQTTGRVPSCCIPLREACPDIFDNEECVLRGNLEGAKSFADCPPYITFPSIVAGVEELVRRAERAEEKNPLDTFKEAYDNATKRCTDLTAMVADLKANQDYLGRELNREIGERTDLERTHSVALTTLTNVNAADRVQWDLLKKDMENELELQRRQCESYKVESGRLKDALRRASELEDRLTAEITLLKATTAPAPGTVPLRTPGHPVPVWSGGGSGLFGTSPTGSATSTGHIYGFDLLNRASWKLDKVTGLKVLVIDSPEALTPKNIAYAQRLLLGFKAMHSLATVPWQVTVSLFMEAAQRAIAIKASAWCHPKTFDRPYGKYFVLQTNGYFDPVEQARFWALPFNEFFAALTELYGTEAGIPSVALTEDDWVKTFVRETRGTLGQEVWSESALPVFAEFGKKYVTEFVHMIVDQGDPFKDVSVATQTRVLKLLIKGFLDSPPEILIEQNWCKKLFVAVFTDVETAWPTTFVAFEHTLNVKVLDRLNTLAQYQAQGMQVAGASGKTANPQKLCPCCGNLNFGAGSTTHTIRGLCPNYDLPTANKNRKQSFLESEKGKDWVRKNPGSTALPDVQGGNEYVSRKQRGGKKERERRERGDRDRNYRERNRDGRDRDHRDRDRDDRGRRSSRDREHSRSRSRSRDSRDHNDDRERRDRDSRENSKRSPYEPSANPNDRVSALMDSATKSGSKNLPRDSVDRHRTSGMDTISVTRTTRNSAVRESSTPIISAYISPILSMQTVSVTAKTRAIGPEVGRQDEIGPLRVMIDTGASHDNYIREDVAKMLVEAGGQRLPCSSKVCSGLTSQQFCVDCEGTFNFNFKYFNELTNSFNIIPLTAKVAPVPEPIFIGDPTCRRHALPIRCFSAFIDEPLHQVLLPDEKLSMIRLISENVSGFPPLTHRDALHHMSWQELPSVPEPVHPIYHWLEKNRFSNNRLDEMSGTVARRIFELLPPDRLHSLSRISTICRIYKKSELLTEEPDEDYVVERDEEGPQYAFSDEPKRSTVDEVMSLMTIQGSKPFIQRLREIILKFLDRFSEELSPEPARIPAMELEVDRRKWHVPQNRGPARRQSAEKQQATKEFVTDAVAKKVVSKSTAAFYSQVHVVPKPHPVPGKPAKWRFCIDYRALNLATTTIGQWIPHIGQLIERIGAKRPKIFGVLDLTSGYYQAPLHENSWMYTAFICCIGIYTWCRVPMGLKGAPAYFQAALATIVLAGLIYTVCELYIDDIIIYARSEDEFCERFELVLERCREFNITFNPKKVKLGLSKVEYVGHMIDESGLTFSREKISEVADFPVPTSVKMVRAFLGLCNFFREHVRGHSLIDREIRKVVTHYDSTKKFVWSDEASNAFKNLKESICNSAKLYFVDPEGSIVLETDASDYGVGAYLYYTLPKSDDPKAQYPIAFLSKSLDERQQRWDTPEKESFAIYLALKKWEHILQNVHFVLRTDHKNLTYLNFAGSAKVYRWKLSVQGFDFDIEHIAGKDNIVADMMSRLCPMLGVTPDKVNATFQGFEDYLDQKGRVDKAHLEIIGKYHNSGVGHSGVERTIKLMMDNGVQEWPHMRKHVEYFIKYYCPCCQKMSQLRPLIHTNPFSTSAFRVMEVINIDLIGPLPPDRYGNEYILVIRDAFSRWTELHAIPSKETTAVVHPLLRFFGTFGWPTELRSDGGKEFVNSTIELLLDLVGTQHSVTLAYSHEENSIVERANKEVMRRLRDLVFDTRLVTIWSDMLPLVQRLMNNQVVKTIGVSPAQIIFGNGIDLDRNFVPLHVTRAVSNADNNGEVRYLEWVDKLIESQSLIIHVAQETLFSNVQKHLELKRRTEGITSYPLGAIVLAQYPDKGLGKRPPSKLHPRWEGPFRVVNISDNGNRYELQDFITGNLTSRHLTDLKLFFYDPANATMSLEDIAIRDRIHEFPVEQVLEHRFKENVDNKTRTTRSSDVEFLVKWRGFNERWNSWEPFKNVRLNETVIDYMKNHQLKRFIPRNLETDPVINHIVHFDPSVLLKRRREEEERMQRIKEEEEKERERRKEAAKEGKWRKDKKRVGFWIPLEEIKEGNENGDEKKREEEKRRNKQKVSDGFPCKK